MILVKNLNYMYSSSNKQAITNMNFQINKGEVFGFLGPSGAGKTTTQRLIIGLLRGYLGHIKILGKERSRWGKDFYEKIGVAFDFPNLYLKLTGRENLEVISAYYKNKRQNMDDLLERVGLLKDQGKRVEEYSKGMKMRLNFIRALSHDPEILFFDEPTSGLDPVNAKVIKDMIIELKGEGKTIFLTTHNMTVAQQLCDRVAFVVDGNVKTIGTPKKLMLDYGKKTIYVEYIDREKNKGETFNMDTISVDERFLDIIQHKQVMRIHSQEATLEDVFIQVTGRELL